jgi:hypothetical protein
MIGWVEEFLEENPATQNKVGKYNSRKIIPTQKIIM